MMDIPNSIVGTLFACPAKMVSVDLIDVWSFLTFHGKVQLRTVLTKSDSQFAQTVPTRLHALFHFILYVPTSNMYLFPYYWTRFHDFGLFHVPSIRNIYPSCYMNWQTKQWQIMFLPCWIAFSKPNQLYQFLTFNFTAKTYDKIH